MSHTMFFGIDETDGSPDTAFHYNSDLSGDVEIGNLKARTSVKVPGVHLLQFVASIVRQRRISDLENTEWPEILGIEE